MSRNPPSPLVDYRGAISPREWFQSFWEVWPCRSHKDRYIWLESQLTHLAGWFQVSYFPCLCSLILTGKFILSTLQHDYKDDRKLTRHPRHPAHTVAAPEATPSICNTEGINRVNQFRILEPGLSCSASHSADLRWDRSLGRDFQVLPLLKCPFI